MDSFNASWYKGHNKDIIYKGICIGFNGIYAYVVEYDQQKIEMVSIDRMAYEDDNKSKNK